MVKIIAFKLIPHNFFLLFPRIAFLVGAPWNSYSFVTFSSFFPNVYFLNTKTDSFFFFNTELENFFGIKGK